MKIKKKIVALALFLTLSINTLAVFANPVSIDGTWNKLSSNQQNQLEEAGIGINTIKNMESKLDGVNVGVLLGGVPLKYENDKFDVSQKSVAKALELLSIYEEKEFNHDKMMGTFNSVIADINNNSSKDTKDDFAKLLSQYGMAEISKPAPGGGGPGIIPGKPGGGGGGPLEKETIKDNLDQKLQDLKALETKSKGQQASFQKALEEASAYASPLASLTKENLEKTWKASLSWQEENSKDIKFAKKNTPLAQLDLEPGEEILIPENLWTDSFSKGELKLNLGSVFMTIDTNTYNNKASKVKITPLSKKDYKQSVELSNTGKMLLPAKLGFYLEDENAKDFAVYQLRDGKEVLIGGIYNPAIGAVEALVKSSGTYVLKKAPAQSYKDLKDFAWAKEEINHLGQKGYIAGKSEGLYAPKDDITRAEFAVLLARILQLPATNEDNKFADLKADDWYYNEVRATVKAGLFNGKSASSFDPKGDITRQEVAAVISRALVQKGYSEPKAEVDKGIWAPGALALLKDQTLTSEIPNFNNKVNQNANRAEVAYILYNLLER